MEKFAERFRKASESNFERAMRQAREAHHDAAVQRLNRRFYGAGCSGNCMQGARPCDCPRGLADEAALYDAAKPGLLARFDAWFFSRAWVKRYLIDDMPDHP